MKRFFIILGRALAGVQSPSLRRRVRVSDIWKSPGYEGYERDTRKSRKNIASVQVGVEVKKCKDCARGDCEKCADKAELKRLIEYRSCLNCKKSICDIAPKIGETIRINCPEFEPRALEVKQ